MLYPASHLYVSHQILKLLIPWPLSPSSKATDETPLDLRPASLDIPPEYGFAPPQEPKCIERFSVKYIEGFRDHATSYCSPDSRSNLTCFHSHARAEGTDSFCIARGATFDAAKGKFSLECSVRTLTTEEQDRGLIPFPSIRGYWYDTGPRNVFNHGVEIHKATADAAVAVREEGVGNTMASPPQTFLLLRRDGDTNTWHSLMEILQSWITFDVLRITGDALRGNEALFRVPEEVSNSQVIIIDEHKDGPYFDLWTLFAQHKPVRLKELAGDQAAIAAIQNANLIVPLAGSSNPLWQPDPEVQQFTIALTLSVFSRRVLEFYHVPDPPLSKEWQSEPLANTAT